MTLQIIILDSGVQVDGSFVVTGVFWLVAPINSIIAIPNFKSEVRNIAVSDLFLLRTGVIVEQKFNSGLFVVGTTITTVQSSLQAQFDDAQATLNSSDAVLTGIINSVFDGTTWAQPTMTAPTIPNSIFDNPIGINLPLATSMGLLPNVITNHITGYVSTAGILSVIIRATNYIPQGIEAQRSIISTSINDTFGGTGANSIVINYLNASFQLKQDIVNLNGTTPVNTNATDIAFIENMIVQTVGSGGMNAGVINIFTLTSGGGTIWASIAAKDNSTYYAHHYVPAGAICYLLNVSVGSTLVAGATTINYSGNPLSTNIPALEIGPTFLHAPSINEDHLFSVPIAIPGPNLIWLADNPNSAIPSTTYGTLAYLQF